MALRQRKRQIQKRTDTERKRNNARRATAKTMRRRDTKTRTMQMERKPITTQTDCIVSSFIIRHSWQKAAIYSIRIRGYMKRWRDRHTDNTQDRQEETDHNEKP